MGTRSTWLEMYESQSPASRLLTVRCGSIGMPVRLQHGTVFRQIFVHVRAEQGAPVSTSQYDGLQSNATTQRVVPQVWTSKSRRLRRGVVRADCFATLTSQRYGFLRRLRFSSRVVFEIGLIKRSLRSENFREFLDEIS